MTISKVAAVCLVTLSLGVPCLATIELALEESHIIPGLVNRVQQLDFNDLENDGHLDILATDGDRIVLYSSGLDSVIWSVEVDWFLTVFGYQADDWYRLGGVKLLFDDIDRDSIPEPIIGLWVRGGFYGYLKPNGCHIAAVKNVATNPSLATYGYNFAPSLGLQMLKATDLDGDGYNELLVSLDSLSYEAYFPTMERKTSIGRTVVFQEYPDSVSSVRPYLISRLGLLQDLGDERFFMATGQMWEWSDNHGSPQRTDEYTRVRVLRGDATSYTQFNETKPYLFHSQTEIGESYAVRMNLGCTGNLDSLNDNPEAVSLVQWAQHVVDYDGSDFTYRDTSGAELVMHRQTPFFTLEEVWRIDVSGEDYSSFVYLPDFPGFFFGFQNDQFTQFYGVDGTINQASSLVPDGVKNWDYPRSDTEPRLVVIDSNEVSIYRPDVVTGIESDGIADALPESFVLSQPYPNPFNPEVSFSIHLQHQSHLRVDIYNTLGRRVSTLYDRPTHAGETRLSWDGSGYASGVYYIKAVSGNEARTAKAVLLK